MKATRLAGIVLVSIMAAHASAQPVSATRGLGGGGTTEGNAESRTYFDQFGEAAERQSRYHSDYDAILSPEDAQAFIERYAKRYDPDNLAPTAMARGYALGVKEAQSCIEFSERTIAAEREIGRTVGYENKAAIYQAGRNLVICRQNLARYKAEAAKSRK